MAKKIHRLKNLEPEIFKVVCIASHENDYKVSWSINEKLKIILKRQENHKIPISKTDNYQEFLHYSYEDNNSQVNYHLLANKSEQGFLIKDMPNIDYFLKISGHLENISVPEVVHSLKEIPIIMTAFEMENITRVKHKRLSF
ncbi:MAG: IPExxxVDY family protein [Bacteroidales bacterium]